MIHVPSRPVVCSVCACPKRDGRPFYGRRGWLVRDWCWLEPSEWSIVGEQAALDALSVASLAYGRKQSQAVVGTLD